LNVVNGDDKRDASPCAFVFRVRIHRRARKSSSLSIKLMTAAHDKTFAAVPASAERPDYVAGRA